MWLKRYLKDILNFEEFEKNKCMMVYHDFLNNINANDCFRRFGRIEYTRKNYDGSQQKVVREFFYKDNMKKMRQSCEQEYEFECTLAENIFELRCNDYLFYFDRITLTTNIEFK